MQKYLEQPRPGAGPARTELLRQAAANQSMPGGLRPGGAASKGANGRQARVRKLSGVQGCQVLSAALAFLSLVLPCACEPACVTHIPIHDLIRQPGNVLWFADGRNITVEQYNIGGCETDKQHPSGVMFVGNYSVCKFIFPRSEDTFFQPEKGTPPVQKETTSGQNKKRKGRVCSFPPFPASFPEPCCTREQKKSD